MASPLTTKRYLGKARRLSTRALKDYLESLNPEEIRGVIERWTAKASRKDLIRFTGSRNAEAVSV